MKESKTKHSNKNTLKKLPEKDSQLVMHARTLTKMGVSVKYLVPNLVVVYAGVP